MEHWRDSDPSKAYVTRCRIAAARLEIACEARKTNRMKAVLLLLGTGLAVLGMVCVGALLVQGIV